MEPAAIDRRNFTHLSNHAGLLGPHDSTERKESYSVRQRPDARDKVRKPGGLKEITAALPSSEVEPRGGDGKQLDSNAIHFAPGS